MKSHDEKPVHLPIYHDLILDCIPTANDRFFKEEEISQDRLIECLEKMS